MVIHVDTKNEIGNIHNFWNHVHFHPTDAIEDCWGKEILDNIASDGVARYVRIYAMLEDIVSRDKEGNLTYDFSLTDKRIDYMMEKGFKLLICMNFMPPCISQDPHGYANMLRYKGKKINIMPPADYKDWQAVVYTYVKHLIDRYGLAEVSSWYFHCWNEPDHIYWYNDNTELNIEKAQAYLRLYDYFAQGMQQADENLKIGGPSVAVRDDFIETFIRHVTSEKNYATGNTGTKLDFVSIHTYATSPEEFSIGGYPTVEAILGKTRTWHGIMEKYGIGNREIIIDEWGASNAGFTGSDNCPEMVYRDNAYFPVFYVKLIDTFIHALSEKKINLAKMMVCMSGQHNHKKDFEGYRAFFTLNMFPLPIYNGYVLSSKLGSTLLKISQADVNPNLGILATKGNNESIQILVYYMDQNMKATLDNLKLKLKIKGLCGNYLLRHYRIDGMNSNAYTKWRGLGSPEYPDQYQRERIKAAGKLCLYYPEQLLDCSNGYEEDIVMTQNSISMLILEKV